MDSVGGRQFHNGAMWDAALSLFSFRTGPKLEFYVSNGFGFTGKTLAKDSSMNSRVRRVRGRLLCFNELCLQGWGY